MYEFIRLIYKYIDKRMYLEKDYLLQTINKLNQPSSKDGRLLLFTQEIDTSCDIRALIDIDMRTGKKFYWSQPSNGTYILSFGDILRLSTTKVTKTELNSTLKSIIDRSVHINDTTNIEVPIFIGGQNFNLNKVNSDIWKDIPTSEYHIPEFLILSKDNSTTITFFMMLDSSLDFSNTYSHYLSYYKNISEFRGKNNQTDFHLSDKTYRLSKQDFSSSVKDVKNIIKSGEVVKVVVSNYCKYTYSNSPRYHHILESLETKYPECTTFFIESNGVFLGASPENVLSEKNEKLYLDALAGSTEMSNDSGQEKLNEVKLISDKKLSHEHNVVVQGITETLSGLDIEYQVGERHILKLKNIQHLRTRIEAKSSKQDTMDILDSIYPTAALSGYPKERSIDIIDTIEPFDRGWYSGVVGWIGKGSSDFYAGLRSAYLKDNYIYIYAGAGITKDSDTDEEWSEVINKMSTMDQIINE